MLPMNHFTPGWNIFPLPFAAACCYKDFAGLLVDYGGGEKNITIPFSETQVCIGELLFLRS